MRRLLRILFWVFGCGVFVAWIPVALTWFSFAVEQISAPNDIQVLVGVLLLFALAVATFSVYAGGVVALLGANVVNSMEVDL